MTEVRATDAAGHVSDTVCSNGVIIDTTGPVKENKTTFQENVVSNPSFETAIKFTDKNDISSDSECSDESPPGWDMTNSTCLFHVFDETGSAQDGKYFIIISGTIKQTLTNIEEGETYRVIFHTSHISFDSATVSSKIGLFSVDGDEHIFMLYDKPYRHDVGSEISWHKHTFYFHGTGSVTTLTIGTVGTATGLAIDGVSVQKVTLSSDEEATPNGHVQVNTVFIHDWSSVHAAWSFLDPQSSIKEYLWAIGKQLV